jgi:hypothetical protein
MARTTLHRPSNLLSRRPAIGNARSLPSSTPVRRVTYYRFGQPASAQRRPVPKFIWIGVGGAGVYYVAHLERVESTGRLR